MVFHQKNVKINPNLCPTGPDKVHLIQGVTEGWPFSDFPEKCRKRNKLDFLRERTLKNKQMEIEIEYN